MTQPDDLRYRTARAMYAELRRQADSDETFPPPSVGPAIGADKFVAGIAHIDGEIDLHALADAAIRELGNVVNEGGTWGVIDLLIEIAGPRCTANEGNHP